MQVNRLENQGKAIGHYNTDTTKRLRQRTLLAWSWIEPIGTLDLHGGNDI